MRVTEILELGEKLRREAERSGFGVNASHLLVHEVMLRAFSDDNGAIKHSDLQAELAAQLRHKLKTREVGHRVSL